MSKWSDFKAKLTGKREPPGPADESAPGEVPQPPRPPQQASAAPPETPADARPVPQEHSEHPMQQNTPHDNPEPSPRQALSDYNVLDNVEGSPSPTPGRSAAASVSGTDSVSRLYARALLEIGDESGSIDELASEVEQLDALLREQPALQQLLATPALSSTDRRDLIDRVFQGRVSDAMYRFLQVVNSKDRLGALPRILTAFDQLVDERNGIVEADVHVAQRLDAGEAEAVARRLSEALNKQVVLHQYVDPSLLGGLVIRVGDRLIDGSVATQLKNMRRTLIEAGRASARRSIPIEE